MHGIVLLRGDTFRGTIKNQIDAYKKMIKYVFKPLKNKNLVVFNITYPNPNNILIKDCFSNYNFELMEIKKENCQVKNFINAINLLPEHLISNAEFLLILRNDLYFIKEIDYSRLSRDLILFQWNLFHNYKEKEIADQIHCIGGNQIIKFKEKINNFKIDTKWQGSLHNLYNFCEKFFEKDELSYLNFIENPNPNENICQIRGNPAVGLGNPLYKYLRNIL